MNVLPFARTAANLSARSAPASSALLSSANPASPPSLPEPAPPLLPAPTPTPIANVTYAASGAIPPPHAPGEPNPGLAALLGFIPGVGAMYNGQYAKGVVHLIVFAILVSPRRRERHLRPLHRRLGLLSGHRSPPHRPRPPRRHPAPQSFRPERSRRAPRLRQSVARHRRTIRRSTPHPASASSAASGKRLHPTAARLPTLQPPAGAPPGTATTTPQPAPPVPPYGAPVYPVDPNLAPPA